MSDPFTVVNPSGQPTWTAQTVNSGHFVPADSTADAVAEIGYGEGGYGEDGYDTPAIPGQVPQPNWTLVSDK